MTEFTRVARCQKCGLPLSNHTFCYEVNRPSFDQTQEGLAEIDEAVGYLLKAIMKHRSIENLQVSTFGPEFFNLLELRRRM